MKGRCVFMILPLNVHNSGKNLTKKIGYLPQDNFIPSFLKVKELFATSSILQEYEIHNKIREKKIAELSGGELRLVEFLWVLSLESKYVLLDEPFTGIAPPIISIIQECISKTKGTKGILLTGHAYEPLFEICDRIVLMHNNAIYNINSMEDLVLHNYLPPSALL